jgi:hypothetical protein
VHATAYDRPPVDTVDAEWINKQMLATGTKLKDIASDTGLTYTHLSALSSGADPLSQPMKALFYYYFMCKQAA